MVLHPCDPGKASVYRNLWLQGTMVHAGDAGIWEAEAGRLLFKACMGYNREFQGSLR